MACDCWLPCSCVYWSLVKARKIVWESQVIDSSSITQSEAFWVWRCDVTTSNSIQDGGALVVTILVFDLRVQLQHCTYQRKTWLFALIEVSTFICKREISGLSSPLRLNYKFYPDVMPREMSCPVETMNSFLLTFINHQVLHGKQLTSWERRLIPAMSSSARILNLNKRMGNCFGFCIRRTRNITFWRFVGGKRASDKQPNMIRAVMLLALKRSMK